MELIGKYCETDAKTTGLLNEYYIPFLYKYQDLFEIFFINSENVRAGAFIWRKALSIKAKSGKLTKASWNMQYFSAKNS